MKGRNRRSLQIIVLFVLLFFIVSTVGLSLVSITQVTAPGVDSIDSYGEDVQLIQTEEITTGSIDQNTGFTGVVLTGQLSE